MQSIGTLRNNMPTSSKLDLRAYQKQKLPIEAHAYLKAMKKELAEATLVRHRASLKRLYHWLEFKHRKIFEVTPWQIEQGFPLWCSLSQNLKPDTCDIERYTARTYIIWLIRQGHLSNRKATDFYPHSIKAIQLPACALEFIEQRKEVSKYAPRRYGQLFNLFHQWLEERHVDLRDLKYEQVRSFLNFLEKRGYRPKPLHVRKLHMRIYLDWLRDRELIHCECRDLFGPREQYRNFVLPSFTEEYLAELRTHLSDKTVVSYQNGIAGFHRFLQREHISLSMLSRQNCVHWMEWMFEKEYAASTRLQRIVTVKGYLSWIVDRRIYRFDIDDLLRSDDLPQLDDLLPRPLPVSVDEEVQKRLRESSDVYHKGALLLRYTGIRLGDLERISANPIQKDEKGRTFLHVPPGKIKVERLVPIEPRTVALIEEIQKKMRAQIKDTDSVSARKHLFISRTEHSSFHKVYRSFKKLTKDLETPEEGSIYPHRLRHTYATSLLNGGIHPAVLMVLLGHTDLRMTFRYARISIELVHRAYFAAYDQIQKGIQFPTPKIGADGIDAPADPAALLLLVTKWLKKEKKPAADKKIASILNRLQKLTQEVQSLNLKHN